MRLQGAIQLALALSTALVSFSAMAKLETRTDSEAARILAQKLSRFTQELDLKETSFKESKGGGGKEVNANDGNSFTSNTTYHSNVWDYCAKWLGGRVCESWVHPYVSLHGAGGDKSPLEGDMYADYKGSNKSGGGGGGKVEFAIWEIEANGSFLNSDGTLDRKAMTSWKLKEGTKNKAVKIGDETASRQIARTFEKGEDSKNTLANMEAMRLMAGRWTKMLRNRLVSNIGDIRAMQPGIEVAQSEDIEDCNKYSKEIQNNMDKTRMEERIDPQNNLAIETRIKKLEDRLKACRQAKAMNAYAVNVQMQGDKVAAGSPEGEWIDGALNRANLLAIDYGGIDPRKANIDGRIKISDDDVKSKIAVYDDGAKNLRYKMMTNSEQFQAYNRDLDKAANGYKGAAARSYFVQDRSEDVVKHKLQEGKINLVKLNDMTPEMRQSLKGTEYARANGGDDPGDDLETEPSTLTVKSK